MKKFFLLLSVVSAFLLGGSPDAHAQYRAAVTRSVATAGKDYVKVPDAPVVPSFTRPYTGLSLAGSIFTGDLSGNRDFYVSGTWTLGAALNALNGTRGSPYRMINANGSMVMGDSTGSTHSISTLNGTDFVEVYGKTFLEPFIVKAGNGQSVLAMSVLSSPGSTVRTQNIRATNIGYTLTLASQGSSTTGYRLVGSLFNTIHGIVSEGEGFQYIGHNGSPFGYTLRSYAVHSSAVNKGRECDQEQHNNNSYVSNCTCINVGQTTTPSDTSAQTNLFQIHNSANNLRENIIYDGAPHGGNLFAHDITIRNCFIRFTKVGFYLGRTDNAYFVPSANLNGLPILFVDCDIWFDNGSGGSTPYLFFVDERTANIEVRDCRLQGINNLYFDNRGGFGTNTLIGTKTTNGNTVVTDMATKRRPKYANTTDPSNPRYLKVIDDYNYHRGRGKFTPSHRGALPIIDVLEPVTVTGIANGTAFASVSKPSTITSILHDGTRTSLNVTWARGSYDSANAGTYRVIGTITPTTGNVNTLGLTAELDLVVLAPPPPPVIKIRFGGTSGGGAMTYIADGTWNHYTANFSTPVGPKGDNSGATLASIRKSDGTLTGWQLVKTAGNFDGQNNGQNTSGLGYPAIAISNSWESFSGAFKITGMSVGHTYTVKVMCSVSSGVAGSHTVTVAVAGSTTSTFTSFNEKGNSTLFVDSTTTGFTIQPNGSGELLFTVTPTAGKGSVSFVQIEP